jgi:hypothetical protein
LQNISGIVGGKMVFSEDIGSCVPAWKNPSRMHGYKWGLLKVREREIQREHGGCRWSLLAETAYFPLHVLLKPTLTHGGG